MPSEARTPTRRIIDVAKSWALVILVVGVLVAVLALLVAVVDPMARAGSRLMAWVGGVLGGLVVGAHDALGQPHTFIVGGPSGHDVLAAQAQAWWPSRPLLDIGGMEYPAPGSDPIADSFFDRGLAEGIGLWLWAMSDAAVRTLTAAFSAAGFGILIKKLFDALFAALGSSEGKRPG